jgi:drug/metabolite transporter (DMT)-like permease
MSVVRSEKRDERCGVPAAANGARRTTPRQINYGVVVTLLGVSCWSLGGLFVRATEGIDAWQIAFYRSWIVLATMGGYMVLRYRRRLMLVFREAGMNAPIAGIALGLAGLTYLLSLFHTTVAQAVFMVGIAPFASALLGWWILGERVRKATWIAMTAALGGLWIMLGGTADGSFLGSMLALFSAFCFSCYNVLLRSGQKTDMTASIIWNALFLIVLSGIILIAPTTLRVSGVSSAFAVGWKNIAVITAMGVVQLSVGLALFTKGSKTVPAAEMALLALAEPMLAPLWVWVAFDEVPAMATLAGGAVILTALVYQTLATARR